MATGDNEVTETTGHNKRPPRGKSWMRVSDREDRRIEELRIAGLSHRAISKETGRARSTIAFRLNTLAMQDDGL